MRNHLGHCYRDGLSESEAAPLVQELVDKYPNDGPDLFSVAGILNKHLRRYDTAIADFKQLCERFPNWPSVRWLVWESCVHIYACYHAQGKGEEGLAYIKGLYAKRPDQQVDFAIAYGKSLLTVAKKPAEAAGFLAKAVADNAKNPLARELQLLLISACVQSNQIDKLAEALNAMAKDAPAAQKPGILLSLVDHYVDSRRFREAAAVCRAVLALRECSDDARAHAEYQLGSCYHNSNMDAAARQAMQSVSDRYPGTEWARKARGVLYLWSPSVDRAKAAD